MTGDVVAALERAERLGPFFRLPVGDVYGWRPALSSPGPAIDDVRKRLGDCQRRVAASTFFLGYAARLLSPAIATITLDGVLPDLRPDNMLWRYDPLELRLRRASGWTGDGIPELIARLGATAIDGHLIPLAQAVQHEASLSGRVLHGNIASAAAGAVKMIGDSAPGGLGEALLEIPRLRGTGHFAAGGFDLYGPPEPGGGRRFVRNSCCLYYRVPGGGFCGDCILIRREVNRGRS